MRIKVDRGKCTGLGICEAFAPDVFEVDEEGHLVVMCEVVTPELRESIEQAIEGCPTEALFLEGD